MDNSDKLIDMVGENKEVMKSVEKRRNIPDKAEIVENAQTITVTNEKPGGIALYVTNNKEDETGMEKDTRHGEDSYKERHGIKEIIKGGIRRKRGRKAGRTKLTRAKQTVKSPPTPCGICRRNLNQWKSVLCGGCGMYIHLQKKCSGLTSEKQYNPEYRCPRCSDDGDEVEIDNEPNKQLEIEKTTGRKRKTTEYEGLPEKLSPKNKVNKIKERVPYERKVGSPDESNGIGKKEEEKDPAKKKPETDGGKGVENEEVSDKAKNANKCLKNKVFGRGNQEEETRTEDETTRVTAKIQTSETLTTIEGIKISLEDRRSLDYGKKVTCTIISFCMKQAENYYGNDLETNKILLLQPAIVQILQLYGKEDVREQKKQLKLANYDWIFFPVNDRKNTMDGDGGSHFSLVIYSKKEHRFFHFDPLNGLNRRSALDLMTNILDSESVTNEDNIYKLPDFEEASCEKQKNGFDCGLFILGYMDEAITSILKGNSPRELSAPKGGASMLRFELAQIIDHCVENNINIIMETEEGIETNGDKLDKLSNEKTSTLGKEKTINKNNENNRKQNDEEPQKILEILIDDETDLDRQKNSKNGSNHNEGIERPENSKERKNKQEEIKTMNGNRTKDNSDKPDRRTINRNNGNKCKYFINELCKYGRLCRYRHIIVCRNWKRNGSCGSDRCTFDHPEPCMDHLRGTCQRRNCWYLHILERTYPKRDTQHEKTTSMNKQPKCKEVSKEQKQNQIFRSGPNERQEIQKEEESEELRPTHQQSINMVMVAMETLQKGIEQILLHTTKH